MAFGIIKKVQSNSFADAVKYSFDLPVEVTGIILATATGLALIGGIKSIGRVTGIFFSIMIVFYFFTALVVVIIHIDQKLSVISDVLIEAFTDTAAAAQTKNPATQALVSMT